MLPTDRHRYHLTCSLPDQIFPICHPWVGLGFAEVPASYLLWCTAELHVLNDEYICVSGTYRCTLIDETTQQWQQTC